ncbi:MAG: glycosyltransferase family 4 protein [Alicyclobacillus herbarius]|uniref:glycosyltransferase family 4 protein n=1 Tax=Alicyclobacillus herbarius TaxID=122960 RepID=UPI0023579C28|nr:glycosyltransferase family 4 protein [Alicyclobacillus herbarius]MCL6632757.1 glycosyltransferase family 4 protein [Alicyclobacillus herbarius]
MKLRILLATFFSYPQPGGLGTHIDWLRRALQRAGHRVDVFAAHPSLRGYYRAVDTAGSTAAVRDAAHHGKKDAVHGEKGVASCEKTDAAPLIESAVLQQTVRARCPELTAAHPSLDAHVRQLELARWSYQAAAARLDLTVYDIIHTQDVLATLALAGLAPSHVPLVQTVHGSVLFETVMSHGQVFARPGLACYLRLAEALAIGTAHTTICPSGWMKGLLLEHTGLPAARLTVIPNGMDVDEFLRRSRLATDIDVPAGAKVVACVGWLGELKGQHVLLEAFARLRANRADVVLWLIGNGSARLSLERRQRALGLRGVVSFLGHRDDVPALLRRTDVLVVPSLVENCPYALMEAQVMGIPVVAARVGGIPEFLVDGETGLLVEPRNAAALAEALERILADAGLRQRLGEHAYRRGREFWGWERMATAVMEVYIQARRGGAT